MTNIFLNKSANTNIAMTNGFITECDVMCCGECAFKSGNNSCINARLKWLYDEHVENPVLTSREWHLLNYLEIGYVARDKDETLWWYREKPSKSKQGVWGGGHYTRRMDIARNLFNFIKWEDTEPHSVEDMLTWKHEEEII